MDYRLRRNGTPLLCEILPLEIKNENEFKLTQYLFVQNLTSLPIHVHVAQSVKR